MRLIQRKPPSHPEIPMYDFFERVIDERDRQYEARFRSAEIAVQAALLARREQIEAAFLASEKAITKAEEAQKEYNQRSNEFRASLDDQAKLLMARAEALNLFKSSDDKLETMRSFIDSKMEARQLNVEKNLETMTKDIFDLRAFTATFVTQASAVQMANRIGLLEQANANYQGRIWALSVGITVLSLIIGVVLHFIP